ncbi:class I tRNA ligase family protein, partial [Patescibacteria group bacterium]|nr:class I tRNA ligase family protein [Patescibacteria group bacterium]
WYFLRYPSVGNNEAPFDSELTKKWLPVDQYIGGNEHACLHLLYCRFVTMALFDLGLIDFQEPFKRFFAHGLIIKDGAKMSKSRGNVINPEDYIDKYGADALRMYLLFLGPINQGGDFRDTGMRGMTRFLRRLYQLANESAKKNGRLSGVLKLKLHQTIKKTGVDYARMKFNTAIAALMELSNVWQENPDKGDIELAGAMAKMLAPVAPHLAEELWKMVGGRFSVLDAGWPDFDEKLLVKDEVRVAVQINGKTRGEMILAAEVALMETEVNKQKIVSLISETPYFKKYLKDKEIVQKFFVPRRLVNIVTS